MSAIGGVTYKWLPNRYITGSNLTSSINIKPDSDIVYTVDVTAVNGCKTKGIAIVYVKQDPNPSSSIVNDNIGQVVVYPNPASNYLTVESSENLKLYLFNSLGVQVLMRDILGMKTEIDVGQLSNAFYTIMLETKNGLRKIFKIEILK